MTTQLFSTFRNRFRNALILIVPSIISTLIMSPAQAATYIGDEEYPWYMHSIYGDGGASMLIIDNSDYMSSEVLLNNGADSNGEYNSSKLYGTQTITYTAPSDTRLTCVGYNLLAYNPDYDYEPWKGVDIEGEEFPDYREDSFRKPHWISDMNDLYKQVRRDAYLPFTYTYSYGTTIKVRVDLGGPSGSSEPAWNYNGQWMIGDATWVGTPNETDLTGHIYSDWNGNKNQPFWHYDSATANCDSPALFSSLPDGATRSASNPNSKGNYANWFAYYRTRRHVLRAIASNVIQNADGRIGMNPVTIDYLKQSWIPMADLAGEAADSQIRKNYLHALYHVSARDETFGGGNSGNQVDALAATFQYMQYGMWTVNFGGDMVPPKYWGEDCLGANCYPDYSPAKGDSPLLDILGEDICSKPQIMMISPVGFKGVTGHGGNNGATSWGYPCPPIFGAAPPLSANPNACDPSGAGYGDVDSDDVSWCDTRYGEDCSTYSGGKYAGPPSGDYTNSYTSATLADITMHYYMTDLSNTSASPALRTSDDQPYFITDMAGFGVTTPKIEAGSGAITENYWGDPHSGGVVEKLDDVFHAAYNGRGEFISPRFPAELVTLLATPDSSANVVDGIDYRLPTYTGSVTKVENAYIAGTMNPGESDASLRTLEDYWYYMGEYTTGIWTGDLKAYHYSEDDEEYGTFAKSGGLYTQGSLDSTDPVWSAEEQLQAAKAIALSASKNWWGDTRKVFTFSENSNDGAEFTWDNIHSDQRDLILNNSMVDIDSDLTFDADDGKPLINYIRGDKSLEGDTFFRKRRAILGDIVNSNPTFVPGSTPMVYVGSNDGMLHGFHAVTGDEVFAYVPKALYQHLYKISKNAGYKHRLMADGLITVAETGDGMNPEITLIGGLGHGGHGYYALDVTNPNASAASIVKWDITNTSAGFADLGLSFSKFQIAKLPNFTGHDQGLVGIIGNGYDSASGAAKLFIVNLNNGAKLAEAVVSGGANNGLSSPSVITVGDKLVAYAGDLNGNIWKFIISASGNSVTVATPARPLFDGSPDQPITAQLAVTPHHPTSKNLGATIAFGTGRYLTKSDHNDGSAYAVSQLGTDYSDPDPQAFFTIGDYDADAAVATSYTKSHLQEITLSTSGTYRFTTLPQEGGALNYGNWDLDWYQGVDFGTKKHGWYLTLEDTGERVITQPYLFTPDTDKVALANGGASNSNPSNYQAGRVIFSTLTPQCNECGNGTAGWLMALRAYDGKATYMAFDVDGDHAMNDNASDSEQVNNQPPVGIEQLDGAFAVSGFTVVTRNVDDFDGVFDANNKANGDNSGTSDLIGTGSGSTGITNLTIRSNDIIAALPGPTVNRIGWRELTAQ